MLIPMGILASSGAAALPAYELISTTILGSAASSVTFTSGGVWAGYKHIQIRGTVRGNSTNGIDLGRLRLNSDAGDNYAYHRLYGDGSSLVSDAGIGSSSVVFYRSPDNANTTGAFTGVILDLLDINNTSKNTTTKSIYGYSSLSNKFTGLESGLWLNTAAVTSITLSPFISSQFAAATRFSIYGIKG